MNPQASSPLIFPERVLADSRDRPAWLTARAPCIGGSDAAGFAKVESWPLYLKAKLAEQWNGNAATAHGNDRERHILDAYKIEQNTYLYRSGGNPRHVATPDGIKVGADGSFILSQVKTVVRKFKTLPTGEIVHVLPFMSAKGERVIPPTYRRQMWWEQHVMGGDRTLFAWEEHEDYQPTGMDPESVWFYRDDAEIDTLITIADLVLDGMDRANQFEREILSR